MIHVSRERRDDGPPVPPAHDRYQEAKELIYHVTLVEVLQYTQIRFGTGGEDQAKEGGDPIDWRLTTTTTTTTIEKSDCLGRHAGRMFFSLDVSSSSYHPQYCHYLPLNEWLIQLSQVGRHMEHRHYTRQEGEGACYIDNGQILLFLHLLRNLDIRRFDLSKKKNACKPHVQK